MSEKWVCQTCLVPNNNSNKTCSCCGSLNDPSGGSDVNPISKFPQVKEQKVVSYMDDNNRVRQKYSLSELKHTAVFVVGSSEVDQLPTSCCDKSRSPETQELQQMYESSLPTPILTLPKMRVSSVSCGSLHTALVTSTGAVYTFGCNDVGALGRKQNTDPLNGPVDSEPTLVDLKFPVKKTTCGDNHTLFLSYIGSVYFCGSFKDTEGPIGVADYSAFERLTRLDYVDYPVKVPCDVEGSTVVSDISSGENHCVLLCQGGHSMYTFGSNEFSQLLIWSNDQVQNATENDVDLTVSANKKLLLTWPQHRTLVDMTNSLSKQETESETDKQSTSRTRSTKRGRSNEDMINQVFTGNCTTFFQTKSLRLYGAGRNAQGEVGVGSDEVVVTKPRELTFFRGVELTYLSGGQFFGMALVNGYVFTWGQLEYLGLPEEYPPTGLNNMTKIKDEEFYPDLKQEDPEVPSSKKRRLEETGYEYDSLDAMERILSLDYEKRHKKALKQGKSTSPLLLPFKEVVQNVFHGSDSLFALTLNGNLYSWGSAQNYILGNGKDYFYQKTPELIPSQYFSNCKVTQGSGGSQHTVFLALKKRGSGGQGY